MTDRNSVLEEVLDKISDLAGEALDNGDAGKGDHWYHRIHGLEDAASVIRALRTPVEAALPETRSGDTSKPSPQEQGIREALEELVSALQAVAEAKHKTKHRLYDDAEARLGDKHQSAAWVEAALKDAVSALSSVGRGGGGK